MEPVSLLYPRGLSPGRGVMCTCLLYETTPSKSRIRSQTGIRRAQFRGASGPSQPAASPPHTASRTPQPAGAMKVTAPPTPAPTQPYFALSLSARPPSASHHRLPAASARVVPGGLPGILCGRPQHIFRRQALPRIALGAGCDGDEVGRSQGRVGERGARAIARESPLATPTLLGLR